MQALEGEQLRRAKLFPGAALERDRFAAKLTSSSRSWSAVVPHARCRIPSGSDEGRSTLWPSTVSSRASKARSIAGGRCGSARAECRDAVGRDDELGRLSQIDAPGGPGERCEAVIGKNLSDEGWLHVLGQLARVHVDDPRQAGRSRQIRSTVKGAEAAPGERPAGPVLRSPPPR